MHRIQVLEILYVYEIIWQMTLGLIPRYLSRLFLHQVVLMMQPLEALVIGGVYSVSLFIFLLNFLNSITILAANDHFLIQLIKESVVFILYNFLFFRYLKTLEGHLQLVRIGALIQLPLLSCQVLEI